MFRSRPPSMPHPPRPSDATTDANYISAQIQQLLALILPQPIVAVLATISDTLYQMTLGKTNNPATYSSTLVPPAILILVTYLAILLVYKSVRSFVSLLVFSLKWLVILGVVGVLLAYHFGNGDVQQGAQHLAQQGGLAGAPSSWTDILRRSQQYTPFLAPIPASLAAASGALPAAQDASQWLSQKFTGQPRDGSLAVPRRQKNAPIREYRDLRPSRNVRDPPVDRDISSPYVSSPLRDDQRADVRAQADYLSRISRWMGADMVSDPRKKQS